MDKKAFLSQLKKGLSDLPQTDINERLNFYSEMIDDYMEEGLSEEEAVNRIGAVNKIAAQILADASPAPKKRSPWKIAAIILGSPIWFSLLIAVFAVILSLYGTLWSVIVSLWSVFVALVSCAFAGLLCGVGLAVSGFAIPGLAMVGAALVCVGLSVFTFYGCKAATKAAVLLTRNVVLAAANRLKKKEDVHNA